MFLHEFIEGPVAAKRFAKGDQIYRQGTQARYFYEIEKGEIAIVDINNEGKEFIQGLYKAGDCFGITALITEKPYTSAAIAHSDCDIQVITKEHFFHLLKESYDFHLGVTRIVCSQLQYKSMMLEEIAIEEGEHRLLTLIHYLMDRRSADNHELDITKQQLADMTGLRVETVIKTLKKIEKNGKIFTKRGKIICLSGKNQAH